MHNKYDKKNVIVFGCGKQFKNKKGYLEKKFEIVALSDNNKELHGRKIEGINVITPSSINDYKYDYVVIAAFEEAEIRNQLVNIGIDNEKIFVLNELLTGIIEKKNYKGKILVVVHTINTSGGFIAPLNAGFALVKNGYKVVLGTPYIEDVHGMYEAQSHGIEVWTIPSLPYIGESEIELFKGFDFVLFNTVKNLKTGIIISQYISSALWLHDPSVSYRNIKKVGFDGINNLKVYGVSKMAADIFTRETGIEPTGLLPYGVEDFYKTDNVKESDKLVFAMIGHIGPIKNQIEFVNAIKKLSCDERAKCEFWIIGRVFDKNYYQELCKDITNIPEIKILGEIPHKALEKDFKNIDVVVCCSVEDMLPINIVEGLMNKKICIVSSVTGIVSYIKDGESAFIYEQGDVSALTNKIIYVIRNNNKLDGIKSREDLVIMILRIE